MEIQESKPKNEQILNPEKPEIYFSSSSIASDIHPDRNEDTFFSESSKGIFGIFDGMGGEKNGQWSSYTTCQIIKEYLNNQSEISSKNAHEILSNARNIANSAIYKENNGEGGTTATFGFFSKTNEGSNQINILHVGDSRAYLFHEGKLNRLTEDDNNLKNFDEDIRNEVQPHLDNATNRNDLTELEYNVFKKRHLITGCVGTKTDIVSDLITETVSPNDLVILLTDGVHDNLTTNEITQIITQNLNNPNLISEKLTQEAQIRSREAAFRSKPDDMTALVTFFSKKGNETSPKSEKNILSSKFNPKIGEEVIVQRTNGDIEGGWEVFNTVGNLMLVRKRAPDGQVFKKTITTGSIERFNRPVNINDIYTSKNFAQLKDALIKLGGVEGSSRYYEANDLLSLINNAIDKKASPDSLQLLTSSGHLRETVKRLVEEMD